MRTLYLASGYFHLWHQYIQQQGFTLDELKIEAQPKAQVLQLLESGFEQKAPLELFNYVMERTQLKVQSKTWLFDMVQLIQPQLFGLLGYITSRSANLYDALHVLLKFSRLAVDGQLLIPLQVEQVASTQRLFWPLLDPAYILLNEINLLALVHVARLMTGQQHLPLLQVHYAHAAQAPTAAYVQFLDCPVYFNQPRYELIFLEEGLQLPSKQADQQLIHLLFQQAEAQLNQSMQGMSYATRVHAYVAEQLKQGHIVTVDEVASVLHCTARSLQRYLKQEHTSFKAILEQERMQRCQLLLDQHIPFSKIADLLGYSDQSALARAYKRVHGAPMTSHHKQQPMPE